MVGKRRRGFFYAFFGGYWSSWYPNAKPWISYKAWWGQPTGSMKFGATMHNGDINNPLVLGFDGSQVHTYASTGTLLEVRNTTLVNETEEKWPKDITAAMRMADNTVYLFRGENAGEDIGSELLEAVLTRPGSVLIVSKKILSTNGTTNGTSGGVRAIRFDGELIHRYKEVNNTFVRESNSPQHYADTREHIPANITGAFIGPDKDIYFFRGNQFCKRSLILRQNVTNNGQLFGCNAGVIKNKDICANSTVEGVLSNKLDPSGREKFIFKGTSRWLLTIGADYITGKLTLDEVFGTKVGNNKPNIQSSHSSDVKTKSDETDDND
ncbi:unnamed protein product [Medioppia subpectinata]|uniref:Uncharacterized protein n=1 Tax=Medioppia subpectinata TaxID=1979941 RepID=A0A7R9KBC2_9ACAR|nr:unnamed protein product [Medioppia subpectinata]CAG2100315.1 unnamed protein product [Medioppia subpectinata]